MWPALEGFVVIIVLILIFGIISLPPRKRSSTRLRKEIENGAAAFSGSQTPDQIDVTVKVSASENRENLFPAKANDKAAGLAAKVK